MVFTELQVCTVFAALCFFKGCVDPLGTSFVSLMFGKLHLRIVRLHTCDTRLVCNYNVVNSLTSDPSKVAKMLTRDVFETDRFFPHWVCLATIGKKHIERHWTSLSDHRHQCQKRSIGLSERQSSRYCKPSGWWALLEETKFFLLILIAQYPF